MPILHDLSGDCITVSPELRSLCRDPKGDRNTRVLLSVMMISRVCVCVCVVNTSLYCCYEIICEFPYL